MKILVVDDSKAMRMMVIRTLRQAGFGNASVLEAANGQEGLDQAMAESPDIILSDWNMPDVNGLEFLRNLRAQGSEIPFGFVTSEGGEDMWATGREAGASFLITKPFTAEVFQQQLEEVLD